jgi:putative heme-binding domain-containing protein
MNILCWFMPAFLAAAVAAGGGPDDRDENYARVALRAPGDPGRGRAVFEDDSKAACLRCHRVRGRGGEVGPDLSNVGAKFGPAHLVESLLEPSRQIVEGYRQTVLALEDGRVVAGIVKGEAGGTLTLVDAEAHARAVRSSEVRERKVSDVSLMPAGLADRLSPAEFADLIGYLRSLRAEGQAAPGSGEPGPILLPPGFSASLVAGGLSGATAMAVAPDGRVFVCEQAGTLRVLKGGRLLPEPFVALRVDHWWERGLIGVALDPEFATNGFVYVVYVAAEPYTHHRVSRFTARGDVAAPGSEVVLLEGDDQKGLGGTVPGGHQGGAIHFGRDGKLYIAVGDQTAGAPAQRLDTFQGKLLRINPDGSIPEDNPFVKEARGKYRATWALGLRNPFTFAVQPETGRIFINDVGQDRWEEVDEGFAGANYGWPESEGATKDPRFRGPIHAYPVASIAGGAFCPPGPDAPFPPPFRGKYFFMDFVKGWIDVLDPDRPADASRFASGLARPVDLAFAPDGLYVLLRDAWVIDDKYQPGTGSLVEIRHAPGPKASR